MSNVSKCTNTSLELLKLVYIDQPLRVLILISINKAIESFCKLL